ncbi:hypothetical protein [Anatilimnocola floriformis]|uniref:hypothetical protein n=1 Tax=Anatilimnocola floriformis TaxID=2948575 RepID=UPI0020C2265A|nr:hypothetical protein [Anatilimnocola floriformis]
MPISFRKAFPYVIGALLIAAVGRAAVFFFYGTMVISTINRLADRYQEAQSAVREISQFHAGSGKWPTEAEAQAILRKHSVSPDWGYTAPDAYVDTPTLALGGAAHARVVHFFEEDDDRWELRVEGDVFRRW